MPVPPAPRPDPGPARAGRWTAPAHGDRARAAARIRVSAPAAPAPAHSGWHQPQAPSGPGASARHCSNLRNLLNDQYAAQPPQPQRVVLDAMRGENGQIGVLLMEYLGCPYLEARPESWLEDKKSELKLLAHRHWQPRII